MAIQFNPSNHIFTDGIGTFYCKYINKNTPIIIEYKCNNYNYNYRNEFIAFYGTFDRITILNGSGINVITSINLFTQYKYVSDKFTINETSDYQMYMAPYNFVYTRYNIYTGDKALKRLNEYYKLK